MSNTAIYLFLLITLTVQFSEANQLITNNSFESGENNLAFHWNKIYWPDSQKKHVKTYRSNQRVHDGSFAQRIVVTNFENGGGTFLSQNFNFPGGSIFEARVWLYAEQEMKINVKFRKRSSPYLTGASRTLIIGPEWREVTIRGGFMQDVEGQLLIQPLTHGNLIIDDVSMVDITQPIRSVTLVNSGFEITNACFGLHINKLGTHNTWPSLPFGTLRLWDTGTTWADINTYQHDSNTINFDKTLSSGLKRLDYYLQHKNNNNPSIDVIYTLAVTPSWAATSPEYKYYKGSASPPMHLDSWRSFVRGMGQRYIDSICIWELWNEVDISYQFTGDVQTLVNMAKIAYEELKAINPANLITSPNITIHGLSMLDEFLTLGGGKFFDIVSFHLYPSSQPENMLPALLSLQDILFSHGLQDKPIWNTEGNVVFDSSLMKNFHQMDEMGDFLGSGLLARAYLVQLTQGVKRFIWYMWDEETTFGKITLHSTGSPEYKGLSRTGLAYREVINWLVGTRIVNKTISQLQNGEQLWILEISRPHNYRGWIIWTTGDKFDFNIPREWSVSTAKTLSGLNYRFHDTKVQIGQLPILIDNSLLTKPFLKKIIKFEL